MRNIVKDKLFVTAMSGAELTNCVDEAIELAMRENIKVILTHNEQQHLIEPNKMRNTITKYRA